MESPLKELRLKHALTIPSLANELGIHYKVYSANESCTYSAPLPKLVKFYISLGENSDSIRNNYFTYQNSQRERSGKELQLSELKELPDTPFDKSPFEHFREVLQISRAGFSKKFCIQVGLLFRLERGQFIALPTDLKIALTKGGLRLEVKDELDYRTGEYFEYVRSNKH